MQTGDWVEGVCPVQPIPVSVKRRKLIVFAAAVGAFVAVIAGCNSMLDQRPAASTGTSATISEPVDEGSKYAQTWARSYSVTTCTDWLKYMMESQKFAAAADILTSARNKIDGGADLPADALIREFEFGITTACVVPSMTLTDVT